MYISAYLTTPQKHFGFSRALEWLAEIGYTHVDYGRTCFNTRTEFSDTIYNKPLGEFEAFFRADLAAAKAAGIKIGQIHAPFPTHHPDPEWYRTFIECQKKSLLAAALLEAPYMVLHASMPVAWSTDTYPDFSKKLNYELLAELLPVAHEYGVKIALENMPGAKHTTGTTAQLIEYIDMMDAPADLCACLDTGHANISGERVGDAVRALGSRLEVLHIHDNSGTAKDEHLPPLGGTIDWDDFGEALREVHYPGTFSFESLIRAGADYYPVIERMQFAFAQTLLQKHGL